MITANYSAKNIMERPNYQNFQNYQQNNLPGNNQNYQKENLFKN